MFNKFPKRSGIYHIEDNIEQLELEIRFWHVNSLLQLPEFEINKNVLRDQEHKKERILETKKENERIIHVKWQEKILSPNEVNTYKDMTNCKTETQKMYHKWLKNMGKGDDVDSESGKKGRNKRRKKKRAEKPLEKLEPKINFIYTYVHDDHFIPKEEEQKTQKNQTANCSASVETMYVYAALEPEIPLLTLKWYAEEKILHVYPDFNTFDDSPYFIEIDTDYRHLYAYLCKNVSKYRQNEYASLQVHLPELDMHWLSDKSELNTQFSMPPKHNKRIVILFEIRDASGFEYDNLHVRYYIHLPPNTLLEENRNLLNGSTHSSSHKGTIAGKAHFGLSCQLTLLCEEQLQNATNLMHIYFELISIDSWERERVEGYAHYSTFLNAGYDTLKLHCVRPTDSSWLDVINRFFIGGRQKFDFVRFFTDAPESEFHCRYKCRMTSTGILNFNCQRLTQLNTELLESYPGRSSGMTLDDIMQAYREARRRLEAVVI